MLETTAVPILQQRGLRETTHPSKSIDDNLDPRCDRSRGEWPIRSRSSERHLHVREHDRDDRIGKGGGVRWLQANDPRALLLRQSYGERPKRLQSSPTKRFGSTERRSPTPS